MLVTLAGVDFMQQKSINYDKKQDKNNLQAKNNQPITPAKRRISAFLLRKK